MAQTRLSRVYETLSARERAVLVFQSWKEGRPEDPDVRAMMPRKQGTAFNEYISLMNAVNCGLGTFLAYLRALIDQLSLRLGWLQTIDLCSTTTSFLVEYIVMYTKEPITESEYAVAEQKARQAMMPVSELAELLAERKPGEDCEPEGLGWDILLKRKAEEIERLVDEGVLVGRRKGKRLLVNNGSFCDWLGEPVSVFPDWGSEYEVFPDDQAEKVGRLREQRRFLLQALERSPRIPSPDLRFSEIRKADRISRALLESLQNDVVGRHGELRAVEIVIDEAADELGIDDPLTPINRETLGAARETLEDVRKGLQRYAGEIKLIEPDEDEIAMMRKLLDAHRDD